MKKILILTVVLIFWTAAVEVLGQSTSPNDIVRTERDRRDAGARNERDLERRMQDLRALEGYARRRSDKDEKSRQAADTRTPELTSEAKERIRQMRLIKVNDVGPFMPLLKQPGTGAFKLFPNFDCLSDNVIKLDGDCADFVPESSDFSFRQTAYTHPLYHDIGFEDGKLLSKAFFATGMLVSLGDVAIDGLDLNSTGVKPLSDTVAPTSLGKAKKLDERAGFGFDQDGLHFSHEVLATENTTYAMRVIAYSVSGELPPLSIDASMQELKFHSLSRDKRDDVIFVFRIVKKDEHGGLIIVWKELKRVAAPKLRIEKGEPLEDIR